MTDRNSEGVSIEMLPLPEVLIGRGKAAAEAWCRANVAHVTAAKDAEIERLRAERELIIAEAMKYAGKSGRLEAKVDLLAKALRKIEKDAPDEMPDLDAWSDADEKAEVAENLVRWHLGQIARDALRDHDQEGKDGRLD